MGVIFRIGRFILRIPPPVLSAEEAVEIANREFEARGWRGETLVYTIEGLRSYRVIAAADMRPSGPTANIDLHTGRVLSVLPRGPR